MKYSRMNVKFIDIYIPLHSAIIVDMLPLATGEAASVSSLPISLPAVSPLINNQKMPSRICVHSR